MFFGYLLLCIIYTGKTTVIGLILLNVSDVMKKKKLTQRRNAELFGDSDYRIRKTYIIPKVFGFIFMSPLIVLLWSVIF